MRKKLTALAFVCALAIGFAAQSDAAVFYDAPRGDGYAAGMTQEQYAKAREIFNNNYAATEETRRALTAKRAELDSLLANPNADKGRIESLSREIGELRGKMLSARSDLRTQLQQNGLNPDFYGPAPRNGYGPAPRGYYGPDVWHHHGRRGGHHGYAGPRRGGMMRGCYGGCW